MIVQRDHGPVRQIEMSTWLGRATGLVVSAFLHRGVLIDTGFPRARAELLRALDDLSVGSVLLTHWHEDHAGNLSPLVARGLPVVASAETLRLHRALPRVPAYRWAYWGHPRPDPALTVTPGEHPFELIPTPGHSPDHIAVFDADLRIAFTGDLFLGVRHSSVLAGESPDLMVRSLRRVIALEPQVVFDAHRGRIDEPRRLFGAKVEWLEDKIGAIRRLVAAGQPDEEIVRAVFGGEERVALLSRGAISRRNFVAAVRRGPPD